MNRIIRRIYSVNEYNWGGGTARELFIYPQNSEYSKRDFSLRVSSARVLSSPSVFSELNGYERLLMPIEGEISLLFEGGMTKLIQSFESYKFNGGRKLESFGICRDLGLIYKADEWDCEINFATSGTVACGEGFTFLYCMEDEVQIDYDILNEGDFIICQDSGIFNLLLPRPNCALIVIARKK